jgi:glycosyltransferase involved in cell wall biosynthesis
MKAVFVSSAVDDHDPVVANHVRWIRSLAASIEAVDVLTLRKGVYDLPPNVTVTAFRSPVRIVTAVRFVVEAAKLARRGARFFFICQGGAYPGLLLPLKVLFGFSVYQWKAHPHVGRAMRFYARWCDDLVFTSVAGAFPVDLPNRRVIGQGIDTTLFTPRPEPPTRDLLMVGRVARSKRLEQAVEVVAGLHATGLPVTLDVVGPCHDDQYAYRDEVLRRVDQVGLSGHVRLLGPVHQAELPAMVVAYRAMLNLSDTAFDKAAGEAMAAGVPVVTSNPCLAAVIPEPLREELVVPAEDTVRQVEAVAAVLSWTAGRRAAVGAELRHEMVAHHAIDTFFDRVLAEIARDGVAGLVR